MSRRPNAKIVVALAVFLALPIASRGDVDQAKELGKYLGQHGYGAIVVDNRNLNRQVVEPRINGKIVALAIDTGCDHTCLTADCARSLKLTVRDTGNREWAVGGQIAGNVGTASVTSFTLKNYEINRTNIVAVLPRGAHIGNLDGLFGFDFLTLNAVILPVGARFFLFKPGNSPAPSIDSYMKAMGFTAIPLRYARGGLRVDGQLNGHPFNALVDCGAACSIFDLGYVRRVSGGQVLPDQMSTAGLDGARLTGYGFMPKHLELGPLKMTDTETTACEAPSFGHEGFNALLGYDLLAMHQAIIDLGHNVLWMK